MKAFAITVDALFGFSLAFMVLVLISTQTFRSDGPDGIYLKMIAMDVSAVLEKTGRLSGAMEQNTSGIREVLEATSPSVCLQISIDDRTNNTIATIAKSGCFKSGDEVQSYRRIFIYSGSIYSIRSQSWYREGYT